MLGLGLCNKDSQSLSKVPNPGFACLLTNQLDLNWYSKALVPDKHRNMAIDI